MTNTTGAEPRRAPQPDDPYGEPIDVGNLIAPLWAGRAWIVAAAVIGTLVGLLIALRAPAVYEATATLMLRQSDSPAATPSSYRTLLLGNRVAASLLKDFRLDQPPYGYSVRTLLDRVLVVEEVRNTSLLRVRVRLPDRELAARVANAVAARSVSLSQEISYPPGALETARVQVENTRERLRRSEERLLTYQRTAQIEAVKTDVDATLEQRRSLPELLISIEGERARLSAAEGELKKIQPLVSARRDVDSEIPMWRALEADSRAESQPRSSRSTAADSTTGPADQVNIRNPLANPVYEILSYQIAASRTKLAALQKQRQTMIAESHINGAELNQLTTLYSRQIQLARLQTDHDLARKLYQEVSSRYGQMRGEAEAKSSQLVIADDAMPPDRPLARGRTRYVMAGFLMGGALGVILVFTRQLAWRVKVKGA